MINLFQKFLILCFIVLFSYSHDSEEKKLKKNETIKKIINYSGERALPVLSGICIAYKLGENKVPLFTKISPTIKNKINNAVHLLLAFYLFHNYFNKKQLIGKEINTNTNKQEEIRQIEQPLKKRYESESKDTETEQREKEMQEIVETLQKEIKELEQEIEQELELPPQKDVRDIQEQKRRQRHELLEQTNKEIIREIEQKYNNNITRTITASPKKDISRKPCGGELRRERKRTIESHDTKTEQKRGTISKRNNEETRPKSEQEILEYLDIIVKTKDTTELKTMLTTLGTFLDHIKLEKMSVNFWVNFAEKINASKITGAKTKNSLIPFMINSSLTVSKYKEKNSSG